MIKVLIADDEPLLLRSLKKTIESLDGEYRVVDTATDGKSALEKTAELNPDVVFTDIRMPLFDGLYFTEEIRKRNISVKIVLISGYKEFEYAKKAITLGVEDYLVKPINPLALRSLLDKMKRELQENIHEKQTSYLQSFIHGGKVESENNFFDGKRQFYTAYFCFGTYISYRNIQFNVSDVNDCSKDIAQILELQGERFWILEGKYDNEKIIVGEADETQGNRLCQEVYQTLKKHSALNITAVYSGGITTAGQFREKLLETGLVLKKELIFAESRYVEAAQYSEKSLEKHIREDRIGDYGYLEKIIKEKKYHDIEIFIKKHLKDCRSMHYTQEELTELLRTWVFVIEQQFQIRIESSMIDLTVTISQDYDELKNNTVSFFKSIISDNDENSLIQESVHTMETVKAYIDYHYTERLSIMEIADKFGFSYSYLCTSFKKCFGESPNDYIIKKRIYKAKILFDTDPVLSIKETAALAGYDNPYYFSRIFKNVTGVTPSEYKKRSNEKNEV